MRLKSAVLAVALATAGALVPVITAGAGNNNMTMQVDPSEGPDGTTVTISGTVDQEFCGNAQQVDIVFSYTTYSDTAATAEGSADIAEDGAYSTTMMVPYDANPGAAQFQGTADCNAQTGARPQQPRGRTAATASAPFAVTAAQGHLQVKPTEGLVSTPVTVSGSGCFGSSGTINITFNYTSGGAAKTKKFPATVAQNGTFSADTTIPADADGGDTSFTVTPPSQCPGADGFNAAAFTVTELGVPVTPSPTPTKAPDVPEAPPPSAVGGEVTFTG
jgi:hypothetical protein